MNIKRRKAEIISCRDPMLGDDVAIPKEIE